MALLTFDGFETYAVVPTSATATGIRVIDPLVANGWTGSALGLPTGQGTGGLTIARPDTATDPDRRTWLSTLYSGTKVSAMASLPWNYFVKKTTITGDTATFGCKIIAPVTSNGSGAIYGLGLVRLAYDKVVIDVMLSHTDGVLQGISISRLAVAEAVFATSSTLGTYSATLSNTTSWAPGLANTLEVSINKVTGVVTVWVNNAYVGVYTSPLNLTTGYTQAAMLFGEWSNRTAVASAAVAPIYVTDMYIVDSDGAAPNARLGKVRVVTRTPTADVQATFTKPVGAATNASVAGQIPPSASNYLTGIADGDTDLYSAPAFAFSNESIIATAVVTSGYKTDASGNNLQATLKLGDTVYAGPEIVLPTGSTYTTSATIFTTNPATGLKFTKAELDAAAFGMRVKAPTT